ncbi:ATP-binding cassette domain-containing protein [Clostridium chromiireducens]|uniref:ATP-binding cassette domain-containing protein n=1 Tax=Clostridium chromiireducens TaxID=225345 RepID=UPI003AF649B3
MIDALKDVQLTWDEEFLGKKCYMLSGGQRQRVAIARSLVMEPKILIADEISAMLDPSTQANLLRVLKGIQNYRGFAMLYITHDLAQARKVADNIYVMHKGKIIENGLAAQVFDNPINDYTKKLIENYKRYRKCATFA